jgi:pimeloyl-ACP methyl ester carboxylesterase
MIAANFTSGKYEEFTVQTFDNGEGPSTMCIGGLAYAPSDFHEYAKGTPGTVHVVDNPIHNGNVERPENWQRFLREKYAMIFKELEADILVGHSCGSYQGLEVAEEIDKLDGLVMITPPYASGSISANSARIPGYGMLDALLADLSLDMTDDQYKTMLDMHQDEYAGDIRLLKSIYKKEIPNNSQESVTAVIQQIEKTRFPILIILGEIDPWNDGTFSIDELSDHVTTVQMKNTGHYPQISKPEDLVGITSEWLRKCSEENKVPQEK